MSATVMKLTPDRERLLAEVRATVARRDFDEAMDALFGPVFKASRHATAAAACLEADDEYGLQHHMEQFFAAGREAWPLWQALRKLGAKP